MAIENTQLVLVEYPANGVVRIVLNNESSFNALSTPMLTALASALSQAGTFEICCLWYQLRFILCHPERGIRQKHASKTSHGNAADW